MAEIDPETFARQWVAAWNARDVEAVLAHFHDDAAFSSPLVSRLGHGDRRTVRGKAAIREYWTAALATNPHLHFRLDGVCIGVDMLVIAFTTQDGTRRAEVLTFRDGRVEAGFGTIAADGLKPARDSHPASPGTNDAGSDDLPAAPAVGGQAPPGRRTTRRPPARRSSAALRICGSLGMAALLAAGASPVSAVQTPERVVDPRDPKPAAARGDGSDASILQLLDRSEAGDTATLREARASVRDEGVRSVIDARLAAARLDLAGTRAAVDRARRIGVSPQWLAVALATRAGAAFAAGDYADAEMDSAAWLALPIGTDAIHARGDIEQMRTIAGQLARLPRQGLPVRHGGAAPTWRDKARLLRTSVTIDGRRQEVVLDTGANLSVLTESTARRLGLRIAGGSSVRSSSRSAVPVRLAVATRLEIAGNTFHNVAFLVMSDADLRLPLPGGYDIPAIVGFPVLQALGRVTFRPDALVVGTARPVAAGPNLVASGSDLFVRATVNGLEVPLHVDSGASNTTLGPRFGVDHPDLVARLERRSTRSAGAGGAIVGEASVLRDATVEVAGVETKLPTVEVTNPVAGAAGYFGTLGQDVLRRAGGYTIDFERMTLTLDRADAVPPVRSGARR